MAKYSHAPNIRDTLANIGAMTTRHTALIVPPIREGEYAYREGVVRPSCLCHGGAVKAGHKGRPGNRGYSAGWLRSALPKSPYIDSY